jgi:hypothetical protein
VNTRPRRRGRRCCSPRPQDLILQRRQPASWPGARRGSSRKCQCSTRTPPIIARLAGQAHLRPPFPGATTLPAEINSSAARSPGGRYRWARRLANIGETCMVIGRA